MSGDEQEHVGVQYERIGSIAFKHDDEANLLVLARWVDPDATPRTVARERAPRVVTPTKPAPLTRGQLQAMRADLEHLYPKARAAWNLGNERRRILSEPGAGHVLDERVPQWFGSRQFSSDIEQLAYLRSDAEDFSKPKNEEERWLRVWVSLCGEKRVGRPTALKIAGKNPDGYDRMLQKRGDLKETRVEAFYAAELAEETVHVASLLSDREAMATMFGVTYPEVSLERAEAHVSAMPVAIYMTRDLARWRVLVAGGTASPVLRELVRLREQRIRLVAAAVLRSQAAAAAAI